MIQSRRRLITQGSAKSHQSGPAGNALAVRARHANPTIKGLQGQATVIYSFPIGEKDCLGLAFLKVLVIASFKAVVRQLQNRIFRGVVIGKLGLKKMTSCMLNRL